MNKGRLIIFIILLAGVSLSLFTVSQAAFNTQINYQGKLTDTSDSAVADGDYNFIFRLCTTVGCTDGSDPIYTETHETTDKITVTDGIFSVLLGSVTSIASVDFNQTLWLEVQVGGTGSPSYETLTPRKKLGAVPAAFEADKLDNIDSLSFLRSDVTDSYTSGTFSFSDATFLDLGAILHDDTANQGFRLPQATQQIKDFACRKLLRPHPARPHLMRVILHGIQAVASLLYTAALPGKPYRPVPPR